jgi:kynurenine formamidase
MVMDEHTGTHLDAPSHGIDPGDAELGALSVSVETIGLDQVRGMAAVIEVTDDGRGDHTVVTVADIERHETEHGPLTAGTIVLVRTGWDARYLPGAAGRSYAAGPLAGTERGWPALDVDAMAALIERGIRCVGTDAPSIGAANTGGPVHDVGFRHGLVFIEGLARLHELPARGAYVMALPLRLRGGTGSPVRAVALVEEAR